MGEGKGATQVCLLEPSPAQREREWVRARARRRSCCCLPSPLADFVGSRLSHLRGRGNPALFCSAGHCSPGRRGGSAGRPYRSPQATTDLGSRDRGGHDRSMIRFMALAWGLTGGALWLVFAGRGTAAVVVGVLLVVTALVLARAMAARALRRRGNGEFVNPRLVYHAGMSRDRWRRARPARGDDGGSELTLGSGW